MTQEIKDKSTVLSVIVNLDKFLAVNSCCRMYILTKDTLGRLNEDKQSITKVKKKKKSGTCIKKKKDCNNYYY